MSVWYRTDSYVIKTSVNKNDGVMVALRVPIEDAKKLAVKGGQVPESLHVTLAYLGKREEFTTEQFQQLHDVVGAIARTTEPLTLKVTGYDVFPETDDGPALYAAIEKSPELSALRDTVVEAVTGLGMPPQGRGADKYVPHITLAYKESDAPPEAPPIEDFKGDWLEVTLGNMDAMMRLSKESESGLTPTVDSGLALFPYSKKPLKDGEKGAKYTATSEMAVPTPGLLKSVTKAGKAVAIDFDGTITLDDAGTENPRMRTLVEELNAQDVRVVIFTARPASEVHRWLRENKWPSLEVTDVKSPDFGVYLDDRAVNFSPDTAGRGLAEELAGFKTWWETKDIGSGPHDAGIQPPDDKRKPIAPPPAVAAITMAWDESKHPRDESGKFAETAGGAWAAGKSPEDQARAEKLEQEANTGITEIENLLPSIVGEKAAPTSIDEVKDWGKAPVEWKQHAQDTFINDYAKDKSSQGEDPANAKVEGAALWTEMDNEAKLHYAQGEVKDFPAIHEPPAFDDSEQGGDEEESEPEMSVDDFGSYDSLPSDWQDEAKEKWMEAAHDDLVSSEKENYEPDKQAISEALQEDTDKNAEIFDEVEAEDEIYPGEPVQGEVDSPEYDAEVKRRVKAWRDNFDSDASWKEGAFEWDDDGNLTVKEDKLVFRNNPHEGPEAERQQLIPGIDRAEMSLAYKKTQWAGVDAEYKSSFKERWTKAYEKMVEEDIENYEPDEDYIKETAADYWDSMSDKEKYKHAKNYLSDKTTEGGGGSSEPSSVTGPIREPGSYALFNDDNESTPGDYKMTGRLGRALANARAEKIAEDRGVDMKYWGGNMETVSRDLWEGWKGSSTSQDGKLLQLAAHLELGAHLQPTSEMAKFKEQWTAPDAGNVTKNKLGAARAYVRGLWETSQYMMKKNGIEEVDVYRGVMIAGDDLDKEETDLVNIPAGDKDIGGEFNKLKSINLKQNAAASWTTKRSVANTWGGVGQNPPRAKRVVLRAKVPRSAVLALPMYGRNYHEEEEVVVIGTPWKKWDAWAGSAPKFSMKEIENRA